MVLFSITIRTEGNLQNTTNQASVLTATGLPAGKYHIWFCGSEGQPSTSCFGNGSVAMRELQGPTNLLCRAYGTQSTSNIVFTIPSFGFGSYGRDDFLCGVSMSRGEGRMQFTAGEDRVGGWYMGIWDITGEPNMWACQYQSVGVQLRNGVLYFNAYRAE